jgi:hypothetical protein
MKKALSERTIGMLRAYAGGARLTDIAGQYGCSIANVSNLVRAHGVMRGSMVDEVSRSSRISPVSHAPVAEVRRLAAKGLTITRIGALLRCPYRDVAKALEA